MQCPFVAMTCSTTHFVKRNDLNESVNQKSKYKIHLKESVQRGHLRVMYKDCWNKEHFQHKTSTVLSYSAFQTPGMETQVKKYENLIQG